MVMIHTPYRLQGTAAVGQRGTIWGRGHRELHKEALGERFLP